MDYETKDPCGVICSREYLSHDPPHAPSSDLSYDRPRGSGLSRRFALTTYRGKVNHMSLDHVIEIILRIREQNTDALLCDTSGVGDGWNQVETRLKFSSRVKL